MQARLTKIDEREVLRYLGCRGRPDAALREDIRAVSAELMAAVRPRLVWRRLPMDASLLAGEDLKRLLGSCTELVLLAATLGVESEQLLHRTQVRDLSRAIIMDACADSAIENVCDNFCADLAAHAAPLYLTDRFSPGYGDCPLAHQRVLFAALDVTRRIGVSLLPSGIMLPQKSVTALIGISTQPQPMHLRGCAACPLKTCQHRRENGSCERIEMDRA